MSLAAILSAAAKVAYLGSKDGRTMARSFSITSTPFCFNSFSRSFR